MLEILCRSLTAGTDYQIHVSFAISLTMFERTILNWIYLGAYRGSTNIESTNYLITRRSCQCSTIWHVVLTNDWRKIESCIIVKLIDLISIKTIQLFVNILKKKRNDIDLWIIANERWYWHKWINKLKREDSEWNAMTYHLFFSVASTKIASVAIGEFNEKNELYNPFEHRDKKNSNS